MKNLMVALEKISKIEDTEERHIALDALMIHVLITVGFEEFALTCKSILGKCWYS